MSVIFPSIKQKCYWLQCNSNLKIKDKLSSFEFICFKRYLITQDSLKTIHSLNHFLEISLFKSLWFLFIAIEKPYTFHLRENLPVICICTFLQAWFFANQRRILNNYSINITWITTTCEAWLVQDDWFS